MIPKARPSRDPSPRLSELVSGMGGEAVTIDEALDMVTPEFHRRWCKQAGYVRPHQTLPTIDQMKAVLSILEVEDIVGIVLQFESSNLESAGKGEEKDRP